jgi:hypothetical protein
MFGYNFLNFETKQESDLTTRQDSIWLAEYKFKEHTMIFN